MSKRRSKLLPKYCKERERLGPAGNKKKSRPPKGTQLQSRTSSNRAQGDYMIREGSYIEVQEERHWVPLMLRGSIRFAYADIVGWDNTDVVFRRLGRIYVVLIARVDSKKQLPKSKRGDKVRTNWRKLIAATPKTTQLPLTDTPPS